MTDIDIYWRHPLECTITIQTKQASTQGEGPYGPKKEQRRRRGLDGTRRHTTLVGGLRARTCVVLASPSSSDQSDCDECGAGPNRWRHGADSRGLGSIHCSAAVPGRCGRLCHSQASTPAPRNAGGRQRRRRCARRRELAGVRASCGRGISAARLSSHGERRRWRRWGCRSGAAQRRRQVPCSVQAVESLHRRCDRRSRTLWRHCRQRRRWRFCRYVRAFHGRGEELCHGPQRHTGGRAGPPVIDQAGDCGACRQCQQGHWLTRCGSDRCAFPGAAMPDLQFTDGAAHSQARGQFRQRVLGMRRLSSLPGHAQNRLSAGFMTRRSFMADLNPSNLLPFGRNLHCSHDTQDQMAQSKFMVADKPKVDDLRIFRMCPRI